MALMSDTVTQQVPKLDHLRSYSERRSDSSELYFGQGRSSVIMRDLVELPTYIWSKILIDDN